MGYVNENRSPLVAFVQMRRVPRFVGCVPSFCDVGIGAYAHLAPGTIGNASHYGFGRACWATCGTCAQPPRNVVRPNGRSDRLWTREAISMEDRDFTRTRRKAPSLRSKGERFTNCVHCCLDQGS